MPTWLFFTIWLLGNGGELIAALVILRMEKKGYTKEGLKERLNMTWPCSVKRYVVILLIFIIGALLANYFGLLNKFIADKLSSPEWMPFHPLTANSKDVNSLYPDILLKGNYSFLLVRFLLLGFLLNIVGEELYYRAVLLPKTRKAFGRWTYFLNGTLFGLKHRYFYWRVPALLPAGVAFVLIFKVGGLPITMLLHWLSNMELVHLIDVARQVL